MTARLGLALLATCLFVACGEGGAVDPAATGPEWSTARGPVEMTVRVDKGEMTVGEKVTLEIDVRAESGVEIVMPEIDDVVGPFAVRERTTPPDVPEGLWRRWRHRYVLDTFTPGDAEIHPVSVTFTDARPETVADGADPIEGTLESEPLVVAVRSVLAGDDQEQAREIRPELGADAFAPFREQQAKRRWTLAAIVAGGVVLVAGIVAIVAWRLRRPAPPAPPVPADVWARAELERLAADGLPARQQFDEFYVRLSGIVREYIERRFGLMAPERTTDEFLAEARRSSALTDEHKTLLREFLRAADMVKFARHVPAASECDAALESARGFVEQTRSVITPVAERAA
ncbi:MAG: hypothetical protein ACYTGP_11000 [Planctomycetota bacterium]|jgi:hypothetical protein